MIDDLKRGLQDLLDKRARLFESEAKPLIDAGTTRALTADELTKDAEIEAAFRRFDRGIEQMRGQIEADMQRAALGLNGGNPEKRDDGIAETLRSILVERSKPGADLNFTTAQVKRALTNLTAADGAGNDRPFAFGVSGDVDLASDGD